MRFWINLNIILPSYKSGKMPKPLVEIQEIPGKHRLMFQTTVPYNTEQNGVAEKMNHTLFESVKSTLFDQNIYYITNRG